jgi:hypothetical protein
VPKQVCWVAVTPAAEPEVLQVAAPSLLKRVPCVPHVYELSAKPDGQGQGRPLAARQAARVAPEGAENCMSDAGQIVD